MGLQVTNILAIETSGNACSVAVNQDGVITQILEKSPREHAKKVLPMVDQLLQRKGLTLNGIDAIAFTRGPGSFTGLRIGFGVVQGLAFGSHLPVIGVSTLQCMAYKAARAFAMTSGIVCPALDARMNEVYWGVYQIFENELPEPVLTDRASTPEDIVSQMPKNLDLAVGEGWNILDKQSLKIDQARPDFHPDAESLASMAFHLYQEGIFQDIFSAELSYVRNEVSWKKREKIRAVRN